MKTHPLYFIISLLIGSTFFIQCQRKADTLFQLIPAEKTGIHFSNTIEETDSFNILTYEYIYNGGGVGIADFNNDGLQDVVFVGNEVSNKLYLNKGDFKFEDVTEQAKINVAGRWNSGIAISDLNNDGWMDMYICATTKQDSSDRKNMLFINQGPDANGIPIFSEQAASYKLDDDGHSVMAAFFDYDLDGDLDVYVLTNQKLNNFPTNYRPKITDGSSENNDRLYQNNGDNTFSNVTNQAGIKIEGFGLGLAIADLNMDGWPDIYVSNDYMSNDLLYINQKDGTFENKIGRYLGHQSQFSMGNDVADLNNDAMPDIVTLDMLPETNNRKKTTIGGKSYQNYINNEQFGYEYQYVRNMLQLNNGLNKGIKFSEVGQLSGIYQTEWSWSPLLADFDNDGDKDLIITNGFPKDITDKDFANYRSDVGNVATTRQLLDSIPIVKIPNYAYKSNGDLTFKDVTVPWGLNTPSFSNGAAFADLDNDGDLDYVVNNINDKAFVYENTLYRSGQQKTDSTNNFLRIKLTDDKHQIIGTKITLRYNGQLQFYEHNMSRGFLSSVEDVAHFGLGNVTSVDSVLVNWPDGRSQLLRNVKTNQVLTINYDPDQTNDTAAVLDVAKESMLFENKTVALNVLFKHSDDDRIDFNIQRTLPHKFSQAGPGLCVGDINNDGLEDFIVGGAAFYEASVYKQKPDGTFSLTRKVVKDGTKTKEDAGLLLFDADSDGDLDLYIVSGSIESQDKGAYQDRLYFNDGKGNFALNGSALPAIMASGSCVRAADYDRDGDLDLFIGGRVVPGSYPTPAESYLLRNDNGKFTNVTPDVCDELQTLGMVTDALWTDYNQDGKMDLVVVGEFMPITFFTNEGAKFTRLSTSGVDQFTGWWNSITGGDFDNDGDVDFVAGNLGLNNNFQVKKESPLKVFAKDFDGNGSVDPVLACYMRVSMESEERKLYPIHFWDELNSQSPKFRNKFSRYKQYSQVTIDQVLTPEDLNGALILEANHMESSFIENLGHGKFILKPLPLLAQVAPVNGMVTTDVNEDGNLDVVVVGNDYGNEVFAGRYDAFTGLILLGDGRGSFAPVSSAQTGFYVKGDGKALVKLYGAEGTEVFVASQNKDSLQVFVKKSPAEREVVRIQPMDSWAEFVFNDGKKQKIELYYGSGYLSQSTRNLTIPAGVKEIVIYDYKGNSRKVERAKV